MRGLFSALADGVRTSDQYISLMSKRRCVDGRRGWVGSWLAPLLLLGACAAGPDKGGDASPAQASADPAHSAWAMASGAWPADPGASPWQHQHLLGKTPSEFSFSLQDRRPVAAVRSNAAASLIRRHVRVEPEALGVLRFSWRVPALLADSDLAQRDKADAVVRIVLAFEGDRSRLSQKDTLLSELARTLTGEEMPYATLMYVWCSRHEVGKVIRNARTARIRKICVESGPARLNRWLDYERDLRSDFVRAFGEAPGALVGMAIMTDTDNTRSTAQAWYGPVQLVSKEQALATSP
jgi:hypothetical protein